MKHQRENIVHRLGQGCISMLIVGCALVAACTQQTKPIGPKFSGRLLFLAGANPNGADLFELSASSNGPGYNYSLVTSGVFEAAPNPDQTQLLYTTRDEILLRDLRNGVVKSLVKGESFCLAWAPDGDHFSYRQRSAADERAPLSESGAHTKLYVSDLDGKSKLIWEDLTATYAASSPGQSAALERAAASSDCPRWIARDRLLFDRFLGASSKQRGEVLKPNTTTIATLSDPVKLSDTDRTLAVEAVCQAGSDAVLRPHDEAQPLSMTRNLDQMKSLHTAPVPCSGCRFIGFAAQSCVPFFIEDTTSTSSDLFYLNPTNWQRQRGAHIGQTFSLNAKMLIKSSARLMIVGDAPASLLLIDTESGEAVPLFARPSEPATSDARLRFPIPVVWIEK
jgi:hypothetical protein